MSDDDSDHEDGVRNAPAAEHGDGADASSSGAPDHPDDVDPHEGTNPDGAPIDNPSGG